MYGPQSHEFATKIGQLLGGRVMQMKVNKTEQN